MLGAPWSAGWEMVKHAGCAVECWVGMRREWCGESRRMGAEVGPEAGTGVLQLADMFLILMRLHPLRYLNLRRVIDTTH